MRLNYLFTEARDIKTSASKELEEIERTKGFKPDETIALINAVDPRNKFMRWILQRIKDGSFRGQEDVPRYAETIKKLEQTNQSNRSRGISAIDIMKFSTISDLRKALNIAPMAGEKGYIEDPTRLRGVKYLGTVEGLDAYAVTNAHSLGKMGIGTEWCTREDYETGLENAKDYLRNQMGKPIYVFRRDGYPLIQASYDFDQFKDVDDEEIKKDFVYNVADQLGILEQTIIFILPRLSKEFLSKLEMPEELQLAVVQRDGWAIKYIKNPSERVQLVAVQQDGEAIQYIDNPSERVQLAAVQQKGGTIYYIKNPSEELQLAAVQQDGEAIQYIDNPSERVKLAAVQQNGIAIQYIEKPSEELKLAAVQQNGYAIYRIKNPSEELQLAAVQQNSSAIAYIKNPSEELQLAAVQQKGWAIQYIENPSENVQLAAVQQNGNAIEYIIKKGIVPSENVQLAAVQQDGSAIYYIIKKRIVPSENVQLAAVQQKRGAIYYIKNPSERVKAAARANGWKG